MRDDSDSPLSHQVYHGTRYVGYLDRYCGASGRVEWTLCFVYPQALAWQLEVLTGLVAYLGEHPLDP